MPGHGARHLPLQFITYRAIPSRHERRRVLLGLPLSAPLKRYSRFREKFLRDGGQRSLNRIAVPHGCHREQVYKQVAFGS
jgi:hypothetical protein